MRRTLIAIAAAYGAVRFVLDMVLREAQAFFVHIDMETAVISIDAENFHDTWFGLACTRD